MSTNAQTLNGSFAPGGWLARLGFAKQAESVAPARNAPAVRPEPASRATTAPAGPCILVVDDDAVVRKALELKLRAAGYQVATAADGPEAIHQARTVRPALVLLDLGFPPDVSLTWDGFGIMNWLHRMEGGKRTPVLLITGSHAANLEQRAQAAGAAGIFRKPLDFGPLLSLIEFHLKPKAASATRPAAAVAK